MCKKLNGENQGDRIIPNSEDSIKFWSDIWNVRKEHNQKAEWLKDCREQFEMKTVWRKLKCLTGKFLGKMVCKIIG